jgi:two-component system, chemotaxis family, CheB/CheR fusion protein
MRKTSDLPREDSVENRTDGLPDTAPPSHYVAVGASAGGLEAIEAFFSHMPPDSGLGFVVIQHLSPDYKSLMVELLSKKTPMSVHRAEDGMWVLPNHVYLIPPKKNLTIFHGKLLLSEQDHSKGINLPIDVFLRSLAEDQGEKTVAIILSGTGSDGTRGVRAIKEYGGMVMVQNEESAKFDGMPRAALSTGLADFVLPPDQMPAQLLSFAQHPYVVKVDRSETLLSDEQGMTRVFALLREKCKVDFTFYKPSTVTRRIERRMTINQIDEIQGYVAFLANNPSEVTALYRELLIGVTSFFRDPAAFDRLAQYELPEIIQNPSSREIRLWVAGCSTGEEAYSLAILVRECMESLGVSRDVKIFATDIDRDAIHHAASGAYPESIAADISPRLLAKYFYKKEDNFQIARNIRETVVFAQHNLIRDPPFTNIALISCRNLLIYLQPILQRKVLEFFNFSLTAGGILMLGTSETTGDMSDYFESLDPKWKLYRSKGRLKPPVDATHLLSVTDTHLRDSRGSFATHSRRTRPFGDEERVLERFLDAVAQDYITLAVIVNPQMEILHVFGDASDYFKLPSGKVVNDISKMATRELAIPLTTGIQKAFRQSQELRFSNIRLPQDSGGIRLVDLRIRSLSGKRGQEPLVAVFITEVKKAESAEPDQAIQTYDLSKEAEERLRELEQDLQFTRENLQATIEELETANEELQATNEELLASNEELQSTNEELQSTNEELFTVNTEYQSKIIELTELNNDVDNLLSATQIGQLLLDENLEVRRFSPKITQIFKLLNSDVGRPITHISHYLVDCDPIHWVREVQDGGRSLEKEVCTQQGTWHLMRVVPYTVGPKAFSGTVISFVDITSNKEAQRALAEREAVLLDAIAARPERDSERSRPAQPAGEGS